MKRRALLFAGGCMSAVVAAEALRPRRRAADTLPPISLEAQIPPAFAGWRIDRSQVPVLPDPELQARLDKIYTQVLARTYNDAQGRRVMVSIAYGADQGSDATSVHRPEFCYVSQGFAIRTVGTDSISVDGHPLTVRRLVGSFGARVEPISYWVTLNDRAVLPGVERKIEQIELGLRGQIPDGMLVRVSSIGGDLRREFDLQTAFVNDLAQSMPPALRTRYFGRADA